MKKSKKWRMMTMRMRYKEFFRKVMFTLGDRTLVPGLRHKTLWCSHTWQTIRTCVHLNSLSFRLTPVERSAYQGVWLCRKQWIVRTMILNGKLRMQKRGVIVWLFAYLLAYLFIRLFILLNFQIRLAFCFVFLLVFVFKLLMWLRTTVLTFTNISGVLHFPVSSSRHLFIINRYLCRLYKLIIKT